MSVMLGELELSRRHGQSDTRPMAIGEHVSRITIPFKALYS